MENVILVIDTGSSSMRGILFDGDGNIKKKEQIPYQMNICGDEATQDEKDFSGALKKLVKLLRKYAAEESWQISAISFTSQRSSLVVLDRNLQVLLPVMMWYDRRAAGICREMNETHGKILKEISGSQADTVLLAPKIRYFQEGFSGTEEFHYLSIQDYLIWLVSGVMVTDPTLGCRTNLMDLRRGEWSDTLLQLYGIKKERLCRLVPCGSIVGCVTPEFSRETGLEEGIPVITAGGDQQCALVGQMITEEGETAVTLGSGGYVAAVVNDIPEKGAEGALVVASACPGKYNMEIGVGKVGTLFNWCIRQLPLTEATPEAFIREAEKSETGANGVSVDFGRLEECMMQNRSLTEIDFKKSSGDLTVSDKARAILECIVGNVSEAYRRLTENSRQKNTIIKIAGGLAKADLVCRIMADMTGTKVYRGREVETTALGAWIQAKAALEQNTKLPDIAADYQKSHTDVDAIFLPDGTTQNI